MLSIHVSSEFDKSKQTYGALRITKALSFKGIKASKKRVLSLMKAMGLVSVHRKKYRVCTTDSKHNNPVAPNILNRDFDSDKPNQKWTGDITYIHTLERFLYLAVIMDLFSRKIIGMEMSDSMREELCLTALGQALALRQPAKDLIHHTDRGSQYAGNLYQETLYNQHCVVSMSRKGNCWDNAPTESFFGTLKKECVLTHTFQTRKEAQKTIEDYILNFYNQERLHSSLDYLSPAEV